MGDPVTSVPHLISAALFRARALKWLIAKVFLEIKNTLKRGVKWAGNERAESCIKERRIILLSGEEKNEKK